jgi:hypothetical protein
MRWRSEGITGTGDLHAVQDLKQLPFYCVDDLGYFEFLDIFAVLVSMAAVRWGQLVKGRVALSSNAYMDTLASRLESIEILCTYYNSLRKSRKYAKKMCQL